MTDFLNVEQIQTRGISSFGLEIMREVAVQTDVNVSTSFNGTQLNVVTKSGGNFRGTAFTFVGEDMDAGTGTTGPSGKIDRVNLFVDNILKIQVSLTFDLDVADFFAAANSPVREKPSRDAWLNLWGPINIFGSGDRDFLVGANATDILQGGDNSDVFLQTLGDDTYFGQNGRDTLKLDGGITVPGEGWGVDLKVGVLTGKLASGDRLVSGVVDVENVTGTKADEIFLGDKEKNVIKAGGGDDQIDARGGNDIIKAGGGADQLIGGAGADKLFAGGGKDTLFITDGKDLYFGGKGVDTISAELLKDSGVKIDLSAGVVKIDTSSRETDVSGVENATGTNSDDSIEGDKRGNVLNGLDGSDILLGRGGDDTLLGGAGPDVLFGGEGNDLLKGGTGPDEILGGFGDDVLEGGPGADEFIFLFTGTLIKNQQSLGDDTITDFVSGTDQIELSVGGRATVAYVVEGDDLVALVSDRDGNPLGSVTVENAGDAAPEDVFTLF